MGTTALRVTAAGLLTTVQDLGRYGYGRFGLPVAGALDDGALRWANLLAGNDPGAAVIEVTFLGPTLTLEGERSVLAALTGANFGATLGGVALPPWRSFTLRPGDTLALGACRTGARGYLAVAGGIDVPAPFGSRATDTLGGIGGLEGRSLRPGDLLPLAPPDGAARVEQALAPALIPQYGGAIRVRAVLGPQDDRFTEDAIVTFLSSPYTVTREADRMGMRLEGPPLTFHDGAVGADIISEGVATGAVQVPAHGRPIVLLAAHQTTGGYAKIATVAGADLWLLGQARPGDTVRFRAVPLAEAQEALRRYRAGFDPAALRPLPVEGSSPPSATGAAVGPAAGGGSDAGVAAPAPGGWSPADVQALIDRVASLGLAEFTIEVPGLRLHLHRDPAATHERDHSAAPPAPMEGSAGATAEAQTATEKTPLTVTAPFIGVFYRGARQGEPPLVEPGDIVEPDQPLGLIEVMKTFHEITAGRRARVAAILADDAAPVEYGQALFTLDAAVDRAPADLT